MNKKYLKINHGRENKMNKILSLFCVSFLVLILATSSFALAEEITTQEASIEEMPIAEEPELKKEIETNIKLPVVKVANVFNGFVIKEDGTEAEQLRIVLTRKRFSKLLSVIDEQIIAEIQSIKETETIEQAKIQIREMLQQKVEAVESEDGVVAGLMIVGKGADHETYRLVAKEITEETAEFDVYKLGAIKITTRTKRGFLLGLRKTFGLASEEETTEVIEEVDTTQIEPIGTLSIERNKYDHIEIDYGSLVLEETQYEGNWDVTAYSAFKLPVYRGAEAQAGTVTGQVIQTQQVQTQAIEPVIKQIQTGQNE